MLGFGTVGQGAYRMLQDNRESISGKIGAEIVIAKVGVRDTRKDRGIPRDLLTHDLVSIVDNPEIDVVLELMGGLAPAGDLIARALANRKHVITANKELIAQEGSHLVALAAAQGLDLHFEAAVGGGIPLVQPLKHQLAGNDVLKVMGIVNGTTNYILSKMSEESLEFEAALRKAQELGYAEADSSNDIDGFDAQFKAAILSSIAFGGEIPPTAVYREGIGSIGMRDIAVADLLGYRIKLLAIAERVDGSAENGVRVRVHPALIPKEHPLAQVSGVYNAVWIRGDFVGDVMFSGRGAGGSATASAVIGDLIDVARNIRIGGSGNIAPMSGLLSALPMDDLTVRFYIRLIVKDQPKVLGNVASVLGDHEISLSAAEMREIDGIQGEIVILTHLCREGDFQKARLALEALDDVDELCSTIRVESGI